MNFLFFIIETSQITSFLLADPIALMSSQFIYVSLYLYSICIFDNHIISKNFKFFLSGPGSDDLTGHYLVNDYNTKNQKIDFS